VRTEFEACLRGLAAAGMVEMLEFSTLKEKTRGADKVLLKAEAIDAYASVIIEAARREPTEIGHLRETDVLLGKGPGKKQLPVPRGDRLKNEDEEQLVLLASVEMFLENEIALREEVGGDILVQRETDIVHLRLIEYLAFGKEVFLGIREFWLTISRKCAGRPV